MAPRPETRAIFDRHHLAVFRYLRRLLGDDAEAEDLTQETFLRVVRSADRYVSRDHEGAWVFEIARNLLRNRRRDLSRRPASVGLEAASAVPRRDDDRIALDRALEDLAEADRDAFLLREVGGLGYDDIAAVLGLTPDAVRSRIHRARASLREALAPEAR